MKLLKKAAFLAVILAVCLFAVKLSDSVLAKADEDTEIDKIVYSDRSDALKVKTKSVIKTP